MGVDALVMAGGRGSRLGAGEKPLVRVCGRPMVEYVIDALRGSSKVGRVVVAVTKHTPRTASLARERGLEVLETPGEGFYPDLKYAIEELRLKGVLTVCADLPLLSSDLIDEIVAHYEGCGKPALTVAAPLEVYRRLGLSVSLVLSVGGRALVPVGVNLVDGERARGTEEYLEEEVLVVEDERAAVNVNTPGDVEVAERMLRALLRKRRPPQGLG